jgi:hypothetical protein
MKVIFRKHITEQILEACRAAERVNKTIDYIELTSAEYTELAIWVDRDCVSRPGSRFVKPIDNYLLFNGVRIEKESDL